MSKFYCLVNLYLLKKTGRAVFSRLLSYRTKYYRISESTVEGISKLKEKATTLLSVMKEMKDGLSSVKQM